MSCSSMLVVILTYLLVLSSAQEAKIVNELNNPVIKVANEGESVEVSVPIAANATKNDHANYDFQKNKIHPKLRTRYELWQKHIHEIFNNENQNKDIVSNLSQSFRVRRSPIVSGNDHRSRIRARRIKNRRKSHDGSNSDDDVEPSIATHDAIEPSGTSGSVSRITKHKKQPQTQKVTSILSKILDVYNVESLDSVNINGKNVFQGIIAGQKNFLKTRLQNLERSQYDVEDVIKTVDKVFNRMDSDDINFKNYLNLIEFTATYMSEKVQRLNDLYNHNPQNLAGNFDVHALQQLSFSERTRVLAKKVSDGLASERHQNGVLGDVSTDDLASVIHNIKSEIGGVSMGDNPDFRDPYSAAYHYYKHRYIRSQNRQLSVNEYYDAIKAELAVVKQMDDYARLQRNEIPQMSVERFNPVFNAKTQMVLKVQNGAVNVASFYVIE